MQQQRLALLVLVLALAACAHAAALAYVPSQPKAQQQRQQQQKPVHSQPHRQAASRVAVASKPIDAPLLTYNIKKARSLPQLVQRFEIHSESFNSIHFGAFWASAGRLYAGQPRSRQSHQLFDRLLPVVDATIEAIATDTQGYGRRELAGTAHGLATAGLGDVARINQLWDALAESSVRQIASFTPRELATTAWAFGKRRSQSAMPKDAPVSKSTEALFAALAAQSQLALSGFTPQGLANLAWACASSGPQPAEKSEELFGAMAAMCERRADAFNPRELAMVAWAFASLGRLSHASMILALARSASHRLGSFSGRELAMLGWAYAVFDVDEASATLFGAGSPFARLTEQRTRADLGAEGLDRARRGRVVRRRDAGTLTQLHQWSLYRAEKGLAAAAAASTVSAASGDKSAGDFANGEGSPTAAASPAAAATAAVAPATTPGTGWPGFSSAFCATCRNSFFAEPVPAPSAFEASIQAALAHMGLATQQKVRTAEGYIIDLVAESSGGRRQVAIEGDGPARFVGASRGADARGSTLLKRRQLRAFGYRLMSVPYWEWEELYDLERQSQYLALAFAVRIGVKTPGRSLTDGRSSLAGLGGPLLPREGEGTTHRQPAEILPHTARKVRKPLQGSTSRAASSAAANKSGGGGGGGGGIETGSSEAAAAAEEEGDASGAVSSQGAKADGAPVDASPPALPAPPVPLSSPQAPPSPAAAAAAMASSSASADSPDAVEGDDEPGVRGSEPTWLLSLAETDFGAPVDRDRVLEQAAAADLVVVGEVYSQRPVINLEVALLLRMVGALANADADVDANSADADSTDADSADADSADASVGGGGDASGRSAGRSAGGIVYVVLEHFSMDQQGLLDSFMAGRLSLAGLVEAYAQGEEGHDVKAYAPLLRFARRYARMANSDSSDSGDSQSVGQAADCTPPPPAAGSVEVKLVGGFVPRALARRVVTQGLESALDEAIARGYVRADEDCAASEAHYNAFEALCTGRNMHDPSVAPTGLARRLFPAQVIKSCSMAHTVARLVDEADAAPATPSKVLVLCGASHMAYNFGVPERIFAAHPRLQSNSLRIYVRESDAELAILEEDGPSGLRATFGNDSNPADVVFVYGPPSRTSTRAE